MSEQGPVALQSGRPDPDAQPRTCENCGTVKPRGTMYSVKLVYAHIPGGVPAFQCAAEQHWGCSHACARAAMLACLSQHIEPGLAQAEAQAAAIRAASAQAEGEEQPA